jgi:hypothetical protein
MELSVGLDDLQLHVVKFGIDLYPPLEIASERTRLNLFYEEASQRWPELFEQLLSSNTQFEIAKGFGSPPSTRAKITTFMLTPRGPVFIFPLALPPPVGATGLEGAYFDRFAAVRALFSGALPGRKCLRIGLVREIIFATGATGCHALLTPVSKFAGAELSGGECLLLYRDAKCNVRIKLQPVEAVRTTQLPVGTRISEPAGHALRVELDVNNVEVRPLEDADIEEVLTRARSLWPDALLEYLNERRAP